MSRNADVEGSVTFVGNGVKVKFNYKGTQYALRMTRENFASLVTPHRGYINLMEVVEDK